MEVFGSSGFGCRFFLGLGADQDAEGKCVVELPVFGEDPPCLELVPLLDVSIRRDIRQAFMQEFGSMGETVALDVAVFEFPRPDACQVCWSLPCLYQRLALNMRRVCRGWLTSMFPQWLKGSRALLPKDLCVAAQSVAALCARLATTLPTARLGAVRLQWPW